MKTSPFMRSLTFGLIAGSVCQFLILWLLAYSGGTLADKAVHYYSAARLFASPTAAKALAEAEPAWMSRLNPDDRLRIRNRLHGYVNYPLSDSLIRLFCSARTGDQPLASWSFPVNISFFLLFLLALGWLIAVTARNPVDTLVLFAVLMAAAFQFALPALAPAADPSAAFLSLAPEGAATLLLFVSFACFARSHHLLMGASLLLAFAWHAGFAAVAVPCALLSFGLARIDRAGNRDVRMLTAILVALAAVVLGWLLPGPFQYFQTWIPAGLLIAFLLAGPQADSPALRTAASLCGLLLWLLLVRAFLGLDGPRHWLIRVTGNPFVTDIPVRLSGLRHLAALALPVTITLGMLDRLLPLSLAVKWRHVVLTLLFASGLIAAFALKINEWPGAGRHAALLLHAEEGRWTRTPTAPEALPALDPRHETAFFSALGDFLLSR
ncbi:MAG: hypothetical protein R6X19_09765 [Kiritimatiellia bacterium]